MAVALSAAGQSGIVEKTAGPVNFGCRLWVLGEGMGYYLVKTLVSALVIVVVSLLGAPPDRATRDFVDSVLYPDELRDEAQGR